jgi:hypothetical protein
MAQEIKGSIQAVEVFRMLLGLQHEVQTTIQKLQEYEGRIAMLANSLLQESTNVEETTEVRD